MLTIIMNMNNYCRCGYKSKIFIYTVTIEMKIFSEALRFGSISDLLYHEIMTPIECVIHLSEYNVTTNTLIAYKNICDYTMHQYNSDGNHFLYILAKPEYILLYSMLDLPTDLYVQKNATHIKLLSDLIAETKKLVTNFNHMITIMMISQQLDSKSSLIDFDVVVRADSHNDIEGEILLRNDKLFPTRDEALCKIIVERILFLSKRAPEYWKSCMKDKYVRFIDKHLMNFDHGFVISYEDAIKLSTVYGLDETNLKFMNYKYPKCRDGKRQNVMKKIIYDIHRYPYIVIPYILGLNILEDNENFKDLIFERLDIIHDKGLHFYESFIIQENKRLFLESNNSEDTLGENIFAYSQFDIVQYIESGITHTFTRPEFKCISDSRINHWTNSTLPNSFHDTLISFRLNYAKNMKFPTSGTVKELILRETLKLQTVHKELNFEDYGFSLRDTIDTMNAHYDSNDEYYS